jgi:hypothetical protein
LFASKKISDRNYGVNELSVFEQLRRGEDWGGRIALAGVVIFENYGQLRGGELSGFMQNGRGFWGGKNAHFARFADSYRGGYFCPFAK